MVIICYTPLSTEDGGSGSGAGSDVVDGGGGGRGDALTDGAVGIVPPVTKTGAQ